MLLDHLLSRLNCSGIAALCAAAALCGATPSMAQTAPVAAASAAAPSERGKRDGDDVFRWILIHADKPKKPATPAAAATAAKDDKPAAVAKAKPAPRSTAKGDEAAAGVAKAQARAQQPTDAAPAPAAPAAAEPAPIETAKLSLPAEAVPVVFAAKAGPEVDNTLKVLERIEPRFPPNLLQTLRKGLVKVGFTVLPDGTVTAPSVMASSSTRLNSATLAAITQWRFAPVREPQTGVVDFVFDVD